MVVLTNYRGAQVTRYGTLNLCNLLRFYFRTTLCFLPPFLIHIAHLYIHIRHFSINAQNAAVYSITYSST